jgi:hypothetical protein
VNSGVANANFIEANTPARAERAAHPREGRQLSKSLARWRGSRALAAWYNLRVAFDLHRVGLQLPTEIVRLYGLLSQLVGLDMLFTSNRFLLGGHFYLFCGALVKLIRHLATLIAKVETLLGLFKLILRRFMIVLHSGHPGLEVARAVSNVTAWA